MGRRKLPPVPEPTKPFYQYFAKIGWDGHPTGELVLLQSKTARGLALLVKRHEDDVASRAEEEAEARDMKNWWTD